MAGASLSPAVVLVLVCALAGGVLPERLQGIANLIADGMAMGLGEFVGEKAEIDYAHRELHRENWEFENYPEGLSTGIEL